MAASGVGAIASAPVRAAVTSWADTTSSHVSGLSAAAGSDVGVAVDTEGPGVEAEAPAHPVSASIPTRTIGMTARRPRPRASVRRSFPALFPPLSAMA